MAKNYTQRLLKEKEQCNKLSFAKVTMNEKDVTQWDVVINGPVVLFVKYVYFL
jgi:ubiquitin-protein ligase